MKTVTLIRHAPTADNAQQLISGRIDTPVSPEGLDLARSLVEELGPVFADRYVSSPLSRAVDTARILFAADDSAIHIDPMSVERNYGRMEGVLPEDIRKMDVDYVEVAGIRHSVNPPGGETLDAVRRRADAFIRSIMEHPAHSTACVSHQTFLQQAHGSLLGLDVMSSLALDIPPLEITRHSVIDGVVVHTEYVYQGATGFTSW